MNVLYVIRGVPGSGKTTLAYDLCGEKNSCASDDFMIHPETFAYTFNYDRLSECHEKCRHRIEELMAAEQEKIAVHNTFITLRSMEPYYELAETYDYKVVELSCLSDFKSVHNVPEDVIKRMTTNFQYRNNEKDDGVTKDLVDIIGRLDALLNKDDW